MLMESVGCQDAATYIQSGNVVFRAEQDLSADIADAIDVAKGFRPDVMVIRGRDYQRIVAANPFPEGVFDPKTLHLFFLARPAVANAKALLADRQGSREQFQLTSEVMYLHCLDYLSGSKIAERAEKLLGVPATARNWNTVSRLSAMLDAM